MYYGNFVTY